MKRSNHGKANLSPDYALFFLVRSMLTPMIYGHTWTSLMFNGGIIRMGLHQDDLADRLNFIPLKSNFFVRSPASLLINSAYK